MSTRRHARKHEALLRLWSLLITPVTPDFVDRNVNSCYIQGHRGFSAGTFDATSYSMPGWRGSGLLDLFAVGTSVKVISIQAMEFDHVYCIAILAGGHTSDSCSWDFMLKRDSASYWIHDGSSPWWTNKCYSTRGHLSGCLKCSLLACEGTAFNLFSN